MAEQGSICIVYPAHFQGATKESHCTAMWLGNVGEVDTTKTALQHVVDRLAHEFATLGSLLTFGEEFALYGHDRDHLVLKLSDHRLLHLRDFLEEDLEQNLGLKSQSEWAYSPHITILAGVDGIMATFLEGMRPNLLVKLDPPVLWWGDDCVYSGGEL